MPGERDAEATRNPPARAECFLLCDFARAENGKLDILGGGWDEIVPEHLPIKYPVYIALKLVIPGRNTVDSVAVRIDLLDEEGRELGEAIFEARLRAALMRGVPLDAVGSLPEAAAFMALATEMELETPGRFSLRLLVDDQAVGTTRFTVTPAITAEAEPDGVSGPAPRR